VSKEAVERGYQEATSEDVEDFMDSVQLNTVK
jgi:hypothetical protein